MIGKLKGRVDSIDEGEITLDVGGVGYVVFCNARTQAMLEPGGACELIIETQVREDHISLFGFASTSEREWFRTLTGVQRVGAKVALAILNAMPPDQILRAIMAKDTTAFSRISGIGGKLAERIVGELKDKALSVPVDSSQINIAGKETKKSKPATYNLQPATPLEDVISALTHLGYSRTEAYTAAAQAAQEAGDASLDQLIKRSLKELA